MCMCFYTHENVDNYEWPLGKGRLICWGRRVAILFRGGGD